MTVPDPALPVLEVVIVDDHADTREVVAEVLRLEGYVVREFATAEDALANIEGALPCAVISDLSLEGLSGDHLARRMRSSPITRGVVLVAVTGHSAARDNLEALWDRVFIKPVDPFELAGSIRELVARPNLTRQGAQVLAAAGRLAVPGHRPLFRNAPSVIPVTRP